MNDAQRYPNGVTKLGSLQRDSTWIDASDNVWAYDEWQGWQMVLADGTRWGSFQTVEGSPPFRAMPS